MKSSKIKVLIVDDSAFIRRALTAMIEKDPDLEIIGTARNGKEGVELASSLRPDVITMDIEMPVMTGIEAVREIMASTPTPVLMISSLTTEGAEATMEAMEAGALDFIAKRSAFSIQQSDSMQEELVEKIKTLSRSFYFARRARQAVTPPSTTQPSTTDNKTSVRLPYITHQPFSSRSAQAQQEKNDDAKSPKELTSFQRRVEERKAAMQKNAENTLAASKSRIVSEPRNTSSEASSTGRKKPSPDTFKIIALGVSTGGPLALHQVIPHLPADLPVPFLIVQHMPPHFTKSLADRLNSLSQVTVKEAQDKDVLKPGHVYIAPGGFHMVVANDKKTLRITEEPAGTLHRPSVDVMIDSVISSYGAATLGVIMTGMGRDGCAALVNLSKKGGYVLAQNEDSCVVYGMPKAVVDAGIADAIVPLEALAETISSWLGVRAV